MINPFTKQARGLVKAVHNLSRMGNKGVSPVGRAIYGARRMTGVKPTETWTSNMRTNPFRQSMDTLIAPAPAIPHGRKLIWGGTGLSLADDAKLGLDAAQGVDETFKGMAQEQLGTAYDEGTYNSLRNEMLHRTTGAAVRGLWDRVRGKVPEKPAVLEALGKDVPLRDQFYQNVITKALLPSVRQTTQAQIKDWSINPYSKPSNKRFLLHPSMYFLRNLIGYGANNAIDKNLENVGIGDVLTNPFTGLVPADRQALQRAGVKDVMNAAETAAPGKYKGQIGIVNDNMDIIPGIIDKITAGMNKSGAIDDSSWLEGVYGYKPPVVNPYIEQAKSTPVLNEDTIKGLYEQQAKDLPRRGTVWYSPEHAAFSYGMPLLSMIQSPKPNPLDIAGAVSLNAVGRGSYGKPTLDNFRINQRLAEHAKNKYGTMFHPYGEIDYNTYLDTEQPQLYFDDGIRPAPAHRFEPGMNAVHITSPMSVSSPGITAHELGHLVNFQNKDWRGPLYIGSKFTSSAVPALRTRFYDPSNSLTNLGIDPKSDAALYVNAARAAAATPMVAIETQDSIRGAQLAHEAMKNDSNISNFDKGRTMAGSFTGLPTYYRQAYSPLWDSLKARSERKKMEAAQQQTLTKQENAIQKSEEKRTAE